MAPTPHFCSPELTHGLDGGSCIDILSRWICYTSLTIQQGLHSQDRLIIHSWKKTQAQVVNQAWHGRDGAPRDQELAQSKSWREVLCCTATLTFSPCSTALRFTLKQQTPVCLYSFGTSRRKGRSTRKVERGLGSRCPPARKDA